MSNARASWGGVPSRGSPPCTAAATTPKCSIAARSSREQRGKTASSPAVPFSSEERSARADHAASAAGGVGESAASAGSASAGSSGSGAASAGGSDGASGSNAFAARRQTGQTNSPRCGRTSPSPSKPSDCITRRRRPDMYSCQQETCVACPQVEMNAPTLVRDSSEPSRRIVALASPAPASPGDAREGSGHPTEARSARVAEVDERPAPGEASTPAPLACSGRKPPPPSASPSSISSSSSESDPSE
mmetsp:Transcript_19756/g.64630  ORF Transcript_19756/g.64630 Transcript_19756/m.64630 type:complete len:247 (-) Transcript_19756:463-1203(-)